MVWKLSTVLNIFLRNSIDFLDRVSRKMSPFIFPYPHQFLEFAPMTLNGCRLLNLFDFNLTWVSMWFLTASVGRNLMIFFYKDRDFTYDVYYYNRHTHIHTHLYTLLGAIPTIITEIPIEHLLHKLLIAFYSLICHFDGYPILWRWNNNSTGFQPKLPNEWVVAMLFNIMKTAVAASTKPFIWIGKLAR